MGSSCDPFLHRQREKQFIDHVERLLGDDRLRIDTTDGRRPISALRRDVIKEDREVQLKRLMSELDIPDRELQSRMPVCPELTVTLSRARWLVFRRTVGRLKVICLAPTRQLLEGQAPGPVSLADLKAALAERGDERIGAVPSTVVLMSTSGFTQDAHEAAERSFNRTVILAEPNDAGGWTVHGPQETRALVDLFDPEQDQQKRQRIRDHIQSHRADLLHGSLSADRVAAALKLPLPMVEGELKSYAGENAGLVARRLGGNVVLFREGGGAASAAGGPNMAFIDRVRALFGGKGETERKVALLAERRAMLSQQRDQAFEEMGVLEAREAEMREQFKQTTSSITRRRIASQLVQLRKDLERRQQLLGVLNQQINVVATHLHNLELVQQGQSAQLPDSEELAADAAAAEEVLAELQANSELAASIGNITPAGLSQEEQALYEELEREASGQAGAAEQVAATETQPVRTPPQREPGAAEPPPLPQRERQRPQAEAG